MTDKTTKIVAWGGGIIALIALFVTVTHLPAKFSDKGQTYGAAGGMLLENYLPYVLYNGGIKTNLDINTAGTFTVGSSGTGQTNQISTTCAMTANLSITATTTGYAFCTGVTGVTSSDNVIASFASTTPGASSKSDNWVIVSSKASSTAGVIDFALLNLTGGTAVPSAVSRIASTTAIHASH